MGDRKGIMSEKGITAGFKSAKKQGCKIVVIDLDEHICQVRPFELSRYISRRKTDFTSGMMEACYVVFQGETVVNVIGADGNSTEIKDMWCSLASNKVVNDVPMIVVDYYYCGSDGAILTGWITDAANRKYYLDVEKTEIGKMVRGWKRIDNYFYFFDGNGVLVTDGVTPDGYKVDKEGKWIQDNNAGDNATANADSASATATTDATTNESASKNEDKKANDNDGEILAPVAHKKD